MGRRGRRHSTGFGYIGFGNNQSTFNQKTSVPFSVYKEKLDLEAHLHYKMEFLHKELSRDDKQKIKNKIRKQERQLFLRSMTLGLILLGIVAYGIYYIITEIIFR